MNALSGTTKVCRKCQQALPATTEHFYKHPSGKYGLTPRCKACVNEDNAANFHKRKEKDPEHVKKLAAARSKKHYHANQEASRERSRVSAAKARKDPEKRERINMRKRAGGAGVTPEEFQALFSSQGNCCAICGSNKPGSSAGWNIDHYHATQHVRFILCCHCNRGFGAFRDNPTHMRKATALLEALHDRQPKRAAACSPHCEHDPRQAVLPGVLVGVD